MSERKIQSQTMPVWPDAGRRLGLGRNGVYDAIKRGEIRVLRFGRRIVVPNAEIERLLRGETA